ncbi:MAG: hypothetical protein LBU80_01100 [Rikenellaceae bacterium]|jgi:hypothetical protein|nr:hypothetical protein [Rikenellaceae bacterium]
MTYRILQHEKSTDQIRIGRVFEDASGAEASVNAVTHALATYHEIAPEEFGKYWRRIAIVDADTLAVIATVYSEEAPKAETRKDKPTSGKRPCCPCVTCDLSEEGCRAHLNARSLDSGARAIPNYRGRRPTSERVCK